MHELLRQRYDTVSTRSHDYGDVLPHHYGKVGIGAVAAAAAIVSKTPASDVRGPDTAGRQKKPGRAQADLGRPNGGR